MWTADVTLTFDDLIGRKNSFAAHVDMGRQQSAWIYELEGVPRLQVWHHTAKGRTERQYFIDKRRVRDVNAALDVLNGVKTLEEAMQTEQVMPQQAQRPGKVSLEAQIAEVDYELAQRASVYPRIAASNPAKGRENEMHVERMKAVRATLVWLRDNEAAIKQRMSY